MRNYNWRPNWLERWNHKIPKPLDIRRLSKTELRLQRETLDLVEKALQERMEIGIGAENETQLENVNVPEPTLAELLEWAREKLKALKIEERQEGVDSDER